MILGIPIGIAALISLLYLINRKDTGAETVPPEDQTPDTENGQPDETLPDPNLPPPDQEEPEPEPPPQPEPEPADLHFGGGTATFYTGSPDILYAKNFPHAGSPIVCSGPVEAGKKIQAWARAYNLGGQTGTLDTGAYANLPTGQADGNSRVYMDGKYVKRTVTLKPGENAWIPFTFITGSEALAIQFNPGGTKLRIRSVGDEDQ